MPETYEGLGEKWKCKEMFIEQPELKLYYDGFGIGEADFCIVADDEGNVIEAVWTRIMNDEEYIMVCEL